MDELPVGVNISVVLAVVALHVDGNVGAAHLRQSAITTSKDAEVGVVIVRISLFPFVSLKQFVWSSTLLHQYGGVSGTLGGKRCNVAVGIGISAYVAGKVAAAVDIMRIEELAAVEELVFLVYSSLNFRLVRGIVDARIPYVEEVILGIPLAVPNHIDRETVILFVSALADNTAFVLRQHYVGVAENVGRSYGAIVDVAVAAAEYLTCHVASEDADVCVGADLSQVAATEDAAINVWCLLSGAGEAEVGIANNQAHRVGMLRHIVVRSECLCYRTTTTAIATCKHGAADVGVVADNDVGGIAAVLHHSHVAATIYVVEEDAALDVYARLAIDTSHA